MARLCIFCFTHDSWGALPELKCSREGTKMLPPRSLGQVQRCTHSKLSSLVCYVCIASPDTYVSLVLWLWYCSINPLF